MYNIKANGETKDKIQYPDYVLKGKTKHKDTDPLPEVKFIKITDIPGPDPERLEELRKQVLYLKAQPQPEQRSEEWFAIRNKMITASTWGSVLKQNKYSHRNAVVMQKCGHPGYQFKGNVHTRWGTKYEDAAIKIYEKRNKTVVWEFGVLPHPHFKFLGASPDGITPDGIMVEIKCPPRRLITGEVPEHYWCQIQGQLEVCKLDRCDFLECKLEEYELDDYTYCEAFFNDHYDGDYTLASNGKEKGIVLNFMDKTTTELEYIHGNLGMNAEEYILWRDKVITEKKEVNPNLIYVDTSFWKLDRISCVPVFRDIKWFYSSLPRLRRCWEDIVYYREVGYEKLLKEKPKTKSINVDITEYLDVESDEEDVISTNNLNEYFDMKKFKGINIFSENKLSSELPTDDYSENSYTDDYSSSPSTPKPKKKSFFSVEKPKSKEKKISFFSSKSKSPEPKEPKLSYFAQIQKQKEALKNMDTIQKSLEKSTKKIVKIKKKKEKCPSHHEIKDIMKEIRQIQTQLTQITTKLHKHINI